MYWSNTREGRIFQKRQDYYDMLAAKSAGRQAEPFEAVITDITLLTVTEAEKLPKKLLSLGPGKAWWLKDRLSGKCDQASVCAFDGSVYTAVKDMADSGLGVRPVLTFRGRHYEPMRVLSLWGHTWTVIADGKMLCDDFLIRFQYNAGAFGSRCSEEEAYKNSEICHYLQWWLAKQLFG